jgi:hypothetical protein
MKFAVFAREHPGRPIAVGVYVFSGEDRRPSVRTVVPLGPPDVEKTRAAFSTVTPRGNTPIGNALIEAKHALDATGLSNRHILVVTDGENNRGYSPVDVTSAIMRQSESARASIYFVAFDIAAQRFNPVRDAGGMVLGAVNAAELNQTLDYLLTGKILAEQPASPTR